MIIRLVKRSRPNIKVKVRLIKEIGAKKGKTSDPRRIKNSLSTRSFIVAQQTVRSYLIVSLNILALKIRQSLHYLSKRLHSSNPTY